MSNTAKNNVPVDAEKKDAVVPTQITPNDIKLVSGDVDSDEKLTSIQRLTAKLKANKKIAVTMTLAIGVAVVTVLKFVNQQATEIVAEQDSASDADESGGEDLSV